MYDNTNYFPRHLKFYRYSSIFKRFKAYFLFLNYIQCRVIATIILTMKATSYNRYFLRPTENLKPKPIQI